MSEAINPPRRSFRRHFQNWLSWAGMVLAAAALSLLFFSSRSISSLPYRIRTLEFSRMSLRQFFSFSV
jgi:hypothetical protein